MEEKTLFPGQRANEHIYLIIREHWFYLLGKLCIWVVFLIALFAFELFVPGIAQALFEEPYINYILLFKNIYIIFLTVGLLAIWAFYYLNMQIITNQRLVDITQDGIFSHTVSELDLSRIQDVTSETKGLFGMVFNFGNVYVQTAGKEDRFILNKVPHPDKVSKMMLDLFDKIPPKENQKQNSV